jgi:hypothetical protein
VIEMHNEYRILAGKLKGKTRIGRIILKLIENKQGGEVRTGLKRLSVGGDKRR